MIRLNASSINPSGFENRNLATDKRQNSVQPLTNTSGISVKWIDHFRVNSSQLQPYRPGPTPDFRGIKLFDRIDFDHRGSRGWLTRVTSERPVCCKRVNSWHKHLNHSGRGLISIFLALARSVPPFVQGVFAFNKTKKRINTKRGFRRNQQKAFTTNSPRRF
jgi:hypothetical protein